MTSNPLLDLIGDQKRFLPCDIAQSPGAAKLAKTPHRRNGRGHTAKGWSDPACWMTAAEAQKAGQEWKLAAFSVQFGGADHDLVGVDLDNALAVGKLASDRFARIVEALSTYTTISVSGTGLHLWLVDKTHLIPEKFNEQDDVGIYRRSKHFAERFRPYGDLKPVRVIDDPQVARELCKVLEVQPVDEQTIEPPESKKPGAKPPAGGDVIGAFNEAFSIEVTLGMCGYTLASDKKRWCRPGGTEQDGHIPAVVVKDGKAYSFSGNDPIANGHYNDSFEVWAKFKYDGDKRAATKAAALLLGIPLVSANGNSERTLSVPAGAGAPANDASAEIPPEPEAPPDMLIDEGESPAGSIALRFGADDDGNAATLLALHPNEFAYTSAYGWLQWAGTHYEREGAEAGLGIAIVDVLKRRQKEAISAEPMQRTDIVIAAKPSARHVRDCKTLVLDRVTVSINKFDEDPHLLNVANGVLDLRSGNLVSHEPGQRFTYCLPTAYHKDKDPGDFLRFIRESTRDVTDDLLMWLQTWLGYTITGSTRLEQMLYIHGPTRAGKGALTETLLALLGPLAREVSFNTFIAKRDPDSQNFDLAPLKNARLIVAGESGKYESLDEGKIKQLVGGNFVTCSFKHRDQFSYKPQYKPVLVSNYPINADPDDQALWQRVRVLEFPTSHAGQEDYGLKERLRRRPALEGMLAWLVEGAKRFYAAGDKGIPTPEAVMRATRSAQETLDYIGQWIDEFCDVHQVDGKPDRGKWCASDQLYQSYAAWCSQAGVEPKHHRMFSLSLKNKGFLVGADKENPRETVQDKRIRVVRGITFKAKKAE